MSFKIFRDAVSIRIDRMINLSDELFYVEIDRDELFHLYLESFPKGTNEKYRERTVHDCNTCKKFIRDFGHVVVIMDGRKETIWDNINTGTFYDEIAKVLSEDVKFRSIAGIYRYRKKTLGGKQNRVKLESGEKVRFNHFYYILPSRLVSTEIASFHGNTRDNKKVLKRSLDEITLEASETVLELIDKGLYLGGNFKSIVKNLKKIKQEYDLIPEDTDKDIFLWVKSVEMKELGRIKNSVIGTLLSDLSDGIDVEIAVNKYLDKTDPGKYNRPSSLIITKGMIKKAQEKVAELDIGDSLYRSFATEKDLTVNNMIFVDKSSAKKMKGKKKKKGSILDNLEPTKRPDYQKVSIDEFVAKYLHHAKTVELMVTKTHINNLMSLTAPSKRRSEGLFKWNNPISWTYNGDFADASMIKQRVEKAGGNVKAFMRISLSWSDYTDLDIHAIEPKPKGEHIYYNKERSRSGGWLDVDMNVRPDTLEPVENIAWNDQSNLIEGRYRFFVNNYCNRDNKGFEAEMELDGQIYTFSYNKPVRGDVTIIEFDYSHTTGIIIHQSLPSTTSYLPSASEEIWGIKTQEWTKVKMVMNSPNHWNGEQIGDKHFLFILEGCLNPDEARGFYNVNLRKELKVHKKVFEVLASKMKVEHSDKQLSGVGFSSTRVNSIVCRITGKFNSIVEITFGSKLEFDNKAPKLSGERVGKCEICLGNVFNNQNRIPCPNCDRIYHTNHLLEWIRIKVTCPACTKVVSQKQVDEITQLAYA